MVAEPFPAKGLFYAEKDTQLRYRGYFKDALLRLRGTAELSDAEMIDLMGFVNRNCRKIVDNSMLSSHILPMGTRTKKGW